MFLLIAPSFPWMSPSFSRCYCPTYLSCSYDSYLICLTLLALILLNSSSHVLLWKLPEAAVDGRATQVFSFTQGMVLGHRLRTPTFPSKSWSQTRSMINSRHLFLLFSCTTWGWLMCDAIQFLKRSFSLGALGFPQIRRLIVVSTREQTRLNKYSNYLQVYLYIYIYDSILSLYGTILSQQSLGLCSMLGHACTILNRLCFSLDWLCSLWNTIGRLQNSPSGPRSARVESIRELVAGTTSFLHRSSIICWNLRSIKSCMHFQIHWSEETKRNNSS